MEIKVAITEDNNNLAVSLIEKLLLFKDEVTFSFRAKNGKDLIEKLKENHAVDVILMDIEMPEMDGIEATEIVSRNFPMIKIIMLTVFDDEEKIFNSIRAGASGYLLKDETPLKILEGIKMIMNGGAPMSPSIASKTLTLLRNPNRTIENNSTEDFSLSAREIEVLEQISKGLDHIKIANNLYVSPSTVRKHIENIYKKLEVHNKVQAVQKAIKHRII
jgi:DNA-binding NarL/FixJ family response regulator